PLSARYPPPILEPRCKQLGSLPIVASVHDSHVLWISAQIDTRRPRVDLGVSVGTSCKVASGAIDGFNSYLSGPGQLRRVWMPGPFSVPIIENARRLLPLLHSFAPISR